MSEILLKDPILWILAAGILFGLAILAWAFGKLKEETQSDIPLFTAPIASPSALGKPKELPFKPEVFKPSAPFTPPLAFPTATPSFQQPPTQSSPVPPAPAVPPSQAPAAAVNPETVDKLIRIVGTVMQQVDILQKQLGGNRPK